MAEVCQSDGQPYPPKSVHQLLCRILQYVCTKDPACPNFLARDDPRFRDLRGCCEVLHQDGVGTAVQHTPIISINEEDVLLSLGVFNVEIILRGCNGRFFSMLVRVFCLRGGDEQQILNHRSSYVEKNRIITFTRNMVQRIVLEDWLNSMLQINKLPKYAFDQDVFYLRPKAKVSSMPWYDCVSVGRNK